jgi:hypothetical protein
MRLHSPPIYDVPNNFRLENFSRRTREIGQNSLPKQKVQNGALNLHELLWSPRFELEDEIYIFEKVTP